MKGILQTTAFIASIFVKQAISAPVDGRCPPHYVYQPGSGAPSQQLPNGELKCGKWDFGGIVVNSFTASSKEECEKECKGDCDVFSFATAVNESNCYHYNSKIIDAEIISLYADEELCSRTYQGVEGKMVEGGCPQKDAIGYILDEFQTSASSVAQCNQICAKNFACTHALFRKDAVAPEGRCSLFQSDPTGTVLNFKPSESFCYVKEATQPPAVTPGELKCANWQLHAEYIGNTTASSKEDCHTKCTGDCDVTQFNPHEQTENCFMLNSRSRASGSSTFYVGEVLCSTTYVGIEPARPDEACSQIRINGNVLNEGDMLRRVKTNAECKALCKQNDECTHALFHYVVGDPVGYCAFFKQDDNEEERAFYPFESICPK